MNCPDCGNTLIGSFANERFGRNDYYCPICGSFWEKTSSDHLVKTKCGLPPDCAPPQAPFYLPISKAPRSDFFAKWTPEMAWVLGLIYADGHLDNSSLALCWATRELCEKASIHLGRPTTIRAYCRPNVHKGGRSAHAYHIRYTVPGWMRQLHAMGLPSGKKCLTMKFPKVPMSSLRHFIRGYFDGDGCVYVNGNCLAVNFASRATNFLEQVALQLSMFGASNRPVKTRQIITSTNKKHSTISTLVYHRKSDIELLYRLFYNGVPRVLYYEPKRAKFDNHKLFPYQLVAHTPTDAPPCPSSLFTT